MTDTIKKTIKVLDGIRFQFQSSLDEVDVDEDCKEAEANNREAVEALDVAIARLIYDEQAAKAETSGEKAVQAQSKTGTVRLMIELPEAEYEDIINDEACGLHPLTRAIARGIRIPFT